MNTANSKPPIVMVELPSTGAIRWVKKVIRDDNENIIDASYSIYPGMMCTQESLGATVDELNRSGLAKFSLKEKWF